MLTKQTKPPYTRTHFYLGTDKALHLPESNTLSALKITPQKHIGSVIFLGSDWYNYQGCTCTCTPEATSLIHQE